MSEKLTRQEQFLLEWLGKEDFSSRGECDGPWLDRLVDLGLAQFGEVPAGRHVHYQTVSLTDAGRAALSATVSS